MSPNPQASNDAMSLFLKKTVEFSKNNSTVEDFTTYIISNFSLKINTGTDSPKYSKNKPKPEEIQKHFKQFIPEKGEKSKPNMFVAGEETLNNLAMQSDDITTQVLIDEIQKYTDTPTEVPEFNDLIKDLQSVISVPFSSLEFGNSADLYGDITTVGVVNRNVDFSPQQINCTSSNNDSFGSNFSSNSASKSLNLAGDYGVTNNYFSSSGSNLEFIPTTKEIRDATNLSETVEKAKRGRPRKTKK